MKIILLLKIIRKKIKIKLGEIIGEKAKLKKDYMKKVLWYKEYIFLKI
jgi:hypothetical protein